MTIIHAPNTISNNDYYYYTTTKLQTRFEHKFPCQIQPMYIRIRPYRPPKRPTSDTQVVATERWIIQVKKIIRGIHLICNRQVVVIKSWSLWQVCLNSHYEYRHNTASKSMWTVHFCVIHKNLRRPHQQQCLSVHELYLVHPANDWILISQVFSRRRMSLCWACTRQMELMNRWTRTEKLYITYHTDIHKPYLFQELLASKARGNRLNK